MRALDILQCEFSAALMDPGMPIPESILGRNDCADKARFAVYRNNVAIALLDTLSARYPVVQRLVGDEFFSAMARAYIAVRRPATAVLIEYGSDFPSFVANFEAAQDLPYLCDMARLENAWWQSYHAPDVKPLDFSSVATLDPVILATALFALHPSLSLIQSEWPIASMWAAHQANDMPSSPARWNGECAVVLRPDAEVAIYPAHCAALVLTERLAAGLTLIDAAKDALAIDPTFNAADALIQLAMMGAIVTVRSTHIEGSR